MDRPTRPGPNQPAGVKSEKMFGKIRASSSSLELEGCPSKLLKDDSFSIYESTLMKLKLGAQRDSSACADSAEMDEVVTDCSVKEAKMDSDRNLPSSLGDEIIMMDTDSDCSTVTASASFSDGVSAGNSDQRKHGNVSILHFFKFKDPGHATMSSGGESKNGSSGCVSSSGSVESRNDSEMESVQTMQDCELTE